MKIMFIILNTQGGMIHYISQLANALSKREDVVVIAPVGVERKNFVKNVKVLELHLGDVIKNFFINTLMFNRPLKFLNVIYKEDPDIIHCNESPLWMSFFLPLLVKFPIVTTIHDVNPHLGSRKFDQVIGKRVHIKFSDCLIVHGAGAKKELNADKKCYVVSHGDYSFFLDYRKDEIDEEENTVLFFGRIEDYKGLEYLIKAMSLVSIDFMDVKLIIAGGGDFSKYENMILDCGNCEVHNRFIPDDEVPILFQRAKLVILPYIEGTQTGIVPIAYAFKKPVIVTDVGSIPDVVDDGKTGFIVPPRDVKALADAIVKLLNDDGLREEMGENAYNKMREELSWGGIAEKTIEVYKEMIRNKNANK